jgi:hypothetical protein
VLIWWWAGGGAGGLEGLWAASGRLVVDGVLLC